METLLKFSVCLLINMAQLAASLSTQPKPHHTLSFFMHDIVGGPDPSARAMTGIVKNPIVNSLLPFAKPNGPVLGIQSTNNDNTRFVMGLSGPMSNMFQTGNEHMWPQPSFESALERLMFGTIMVFDDELTQGHKPGSNSIGKAQGFYVTSSLDGKSQSMDFTVMLKYGNYIDTLNFLGIHRTGVSDSQLAIVGGTGKYVNAKGYATITSVSLNDQQVMDGQQTVLEFLVFVTS